MNKPQWLEVAEKEIGQHEIRGGENPRIIEYHSTTTLKASEDEVPWCSSFVNWCMKQSGGIEGTRSALAKSWLRWGREITTPELGCICVVRNKNAQNDPNTGSTTGYHVGFWLSENDDIIHLIGGNQGDQVKMSRFLKRSYEVHGYRMPLQS